MDEIIETIKRESIHCDRKAGCDASGGSLGHGIGIGIGFAIANPDIKVHVIISDGSIMEGSNWEACRLIEDLKINNIQLYCNFNGYSAVQEVNLERLIHRLRVFNSKAKIYFSNNGVGFEGVQGHYKKL